MERMLTSTGHLSKDTSGKNSTGVNHSVWPYVTATYDYYLVAPSQQYWRNVRRTSSSSVHGLKHHLPFSTSLATQQ